MRVRMLACMLALTAARTRARTESHMHDILVNACDTAWHCSIGHVEALDATYCYLTPGLSVSTAGRCCRDSCLDYGKASILVLCLPGPYRLPAVSPMMFASQRLMNTELDMFDLSAAGRMGAVGAGPSRSPPFIEPIRQSCPAKRAWLLGSIY